MAISVQSNIKNKKHRFRLSAEEKEIIKDIGRFLLGVGIAGAALAVIAVAPNALQLAGLFVKKNPKYRDREEQTQKIFTKLFKNKVLRLVQKNKKEYLEITDKGKRELVEFDIDTIAIKKQKWDGRWRVVIYDIPEDKKIARDVLRDKMQEIGFVKIQKSVWACPYECEKEIGFISSVYEAEKYVNYLIVEKADFSDSLRKIFDI